MRSVPGGIRVNLTQANTVPQQVVPIAPSPTPIQPSYIEYTKDGKDVPQPLVKFPRDAGKASVIDVL